MDTKYLVEFIALAKNENYWQTANDLFISQSSLSKHIFSLESELGTTLFYRTTRKVKLTADGEIFLTYAQKIIDQLEEYRAVSESYQKSRHKRISIASTSQISNYTIITDKLTGFKQQNAECVLDVLIEPHKNLKKLLLDGKADFVWIGESEEELDEPGFIRIPFITESLVAVFSKKTFPQAPLQITDLKDLEGKELVIQGNSSIENRIFLKLCQINDISPNISFLPTASIMDFIKRELGVAILLRSVAEAFPQDEFSIASISCSPSIHVGLMYLKNATLSSASKSFLRFLQSD